MTTVSGTLSGESASALLSAYNQAEEVDYTITGPFGGKVCFEKHNPGMTAHTPVVTLVPALTSKSGRIHLDPNTRLRVRLCDNIVAVANGNFDTDTVWTKGAGWTIATGTGIATGGISTAISQVLSGIVAGASYDVTYTITRSAGSIAATLGGGSAGTSRSTSATFTDTLVAGATQVLAFTGTGFTGTIDVVSIVPRVTYTFSDTDAILDERKDTDGTLIAQWLQSGLNLLKNLTVAGVVTFTSAATFAINGLTYRPGGRISTFVGPSAAVTATASETIAATTTIPANTLQAGQVLKVRFQGIATATNASDTLAVKLYINGTTGTALISIPATDATNNDVFTGEYVVQFRTIGASGTMAGHGTFKSIPAAEGTMTIKDDILASTAIDTTAAITVDVSLTWSSNNAGNSARVDNFVVEIV